MRLSPKLEAYLEVTDPKPIRLSTERLESLIQEWYSRHLLDTDYKYLTRYERHKIRNKGELTIDWLDLRRIRTRVQPVIIVWSLVSIVDQFVTYTSNLISLSANDDNVAEEIVYNLNRAWSQIGSDHLLEMDQPAITVFTPELKAITCFVDEWKELSLSLSTA